VFVSSYNTYVQTDSSVKDAKQKLQKPNSSSDSFAQKLAQKTPTANFTSSPIPAEFISKNQANINKQNLEFQKEQTKNPQDVSAKEIKETLKKFSANNSLTSAKNAYENSNKMYFLFPKQAISIDQTPKMDKNLPQEAYEAKELNMRHKMVNTYVSNDKYYQITA
jgi:hypothetical protein